MGSHWSRKQYSLKLLNTFSYLILMIALWEATIIIMISVLQKNMKKKIHKCVKVGCFINKRGKIN